MKTAKDVVEYLEFRQSLFGREAAIVACSKHYGNEYQSVLGQHMENAELLQELIADIKDRLE